MKAYDVTGMTCGGCVKAVEKALASVGLKADVNLETGRVEVAGAPDDAVVVEVIERAGFELEPART